MPSASIRCRMLDLLLDGRRRAPTATAARRAASRRRASRRGGGGRRADLVPVVDQAIRSSTAMTSADRRCSPTCTAAAPQRTPAPATSTGDARRDGRARRRTRGRKPSSMVSSGAPCAQRADLLARRTRRRRGARCRSKVDVPDDEREGEPSRTQRRSCAGGHLGPVYFTTSAVTSSYCSAPRAKSLHGIDDAARA